MNDAAALFARLQLRPDAGEKDVRRAYARELKQIDQETQAAEFQALRETYEQLMWWLRRQQQEAAQQAAQDQTQGGGREDGATSGREGAEVAAAAGQAVPEDAARAAGSGPQEASAQDQPRQEPEAPLAAGPAAAPALPGPEALGHAVLTELTARLSGDGFLTREDMAGFLQACLDDARLESFDARQYFEWGVASILASGWRPGHDLLLGPAMTLFNWRDDRSRLMWLGQPGHIVDAAIAELALFDTQGKAERDRQAQVIRLLRGTARPPVSQLLAELPVAEAVAQTFPNWLHVITRTQSIVDWRRWEAEIPAWRRWIARKGRPARQAQPEQPQRLEPASGLSAAGALGIVFLVLVLFTTAGRLSQGPQPDVLATSTAVTAARMVEQHNMQQQRLRDQVAAQRRPVPVPRDVDPRQAREDAQRLAKGRATPERCGDAADLVRMNPATNERGDLGQAFDRLLMDCLVKKMGNLTPDVFDPSFKREQARLKKDIQQLMAQPVRGAPTIEPSTDLWVPRERSAVASPPVEPQGLTGAPTAPPRKGGLGLQADPQHLDQLLPARPAP